MMSAFKIGIILCACFSLVKLQATIETEIETNPQTEANIGHSFGCKLPEQPDHGHFTINSGKVDNEIAERWTNLVFSCDDGYLLSADQVLTCLGLTWNKNPPRCLRSCSPLKGNTVKITCTLGGNPVSCTEDVIEGTVAKVECKELFEVRSIQTQPVIESFCYGGHWDKSSEQLLNCEPECGAVVPRGSVLVRDGYTSYSGEFPWHIGIYRRTNEDPIQICGGTLISLHIVISAAHCFWDFTKNVPENVDKYAVAAGKVHRPWTHRNDKYAQHNEIRGLVIPQRFLGEQNTWSNDIALLVLKKAFIISPFVHPVCMDWSNVVTNELLVNGSFGLVAGWGLLRGESDYADELQAVRLPFVSNKECVNKVPFDFKRFITTDKICAGFTNETGVASGDSGGGLVFTKNNRYYLEGVVSASPNSDKKAGYAAFTAIKAHISWIRKIELKNRIVGACDPEIDDDCAALDIDEVNSPCGPLGTVESTRGMTCKYKQTVVECSKPMAPGTVVTLECFYNRTTEQKAICRNGRWTRQLQPCNWECGDNVPLEPGVRDQGAKFPWHVGIYRKFGEKLIQVCAGVLLHDDLVLTAASCFFRDNNNSRSLVNASDYMLSFGNVHRQWKHPNDSSYAAYSDILRIVIHENYTGIDTNYTNDIALVSLSILNVQYSDYIFTVCFEKNDTLKHLKTTFGDFSGWGSTPASLWSSELEKNDDEVLKYSQMNFFPKEQCLQKARGQIKQFITEGKFCARFSEETRNIGLGETGAGLTVKWNRQHYLVGITSLTFGADFSLFTDITYYAKWLDKQKVDIFFQKVFDTLQSVKWVNG